LLSPARPLLVLLLLTGCDALPAEGLLPDAAPTSGIGQFFTTFCTACHAGGAAAGGLEDVLDADALIQTGQIVPGSPESSPLFLRVRDGSMPPVGIEPRPAEADIAVLEAWIRAGAPSIDRPQGPDGFVTFEELVDGIALDLAQVDAIDRPFQRWISLAPLYNAGEPIDQAAAGLVLAVNGLSNEADLVELVRVGPEGLALRFDLRDVGWSRESWSELVAEATFRPLLSGHPAAQFVSGLTLEARPVVPADWFVATAWSPEHYHALLALPESFDGLAARGLPVDVPPSRAAFARSGVSAHNRAVDYLRGNGLRLWRSWDFDGSDGDRNVVVRPATALPFAAGGEVIFDLPNGLHGYLLLDAEGLRIDAAPTRIVHDAAAVDGVVRTGGSCVRCHGAEGILPLNDDAGPVAELFGSGEAAQINPAFVAAGVTTARDLYTDALGSVADPRSAHAGFVSLMDRRRGAVDPAEAAARLGVHPDLLDALLIDSLALVPADAVPLVLGQAIPRDAFEGAIEDLLCALVGEACGP